MMMKEETIIPINDDYPLDEEIAELPLLRRIIEKKVKGDTIGFWFLWG